MMLSLDTAYRSFGGEVEASSTPTICRLPDSRRHQLSAIAPLLAAIGDAPVVDLCYEAFRAHCENEALRSEHSPTGAPKRRGRKRRCLRLACFLVTARPWLRSISHLPHLRLHGGHYDSDHHFTRRNFSFVSSHIRPHASKRI